MPAQRQPARRWAIKTPGNHALVVGTNRARLTQATRGTQAYVIPVCSYLGCRQGPRGQPGTLEGMSDSARYCTDRCRAAQWKADHNYGRHEPRQRRTNAGPPPLVGVKLRRELNEAIKPVAADAGLSVREWVERVITDALG